MMINLKAWRERLKLTQELVAQLLGLSRRGWINREAEGASVGSETAYAVAYVSERLREGHPPDADGLTALAIKEISGEAQTYAAEYAGRLQRVLALMNENRRGHSFTTARLAEIMGLERAGDLGRYMSGAEEPSFKFLEAFASTFGVDPEWLKFGYGSSLFAVERSCGFEPLAFLNRVKDLRPKGVYFVRNRSETAEALIIVQLSDYRYVQSATLNHVSDKVGATGERQLADLHDVILQIRDEKVLGHHVSMMGFHVDPQTYSTLVNGKMFPGSAIGGANFDPWWDDFGDLCEEERRISDYGPGFRSAVWRVKSFKRYRDAPQ